MSNGTYTGFFVFIVEQWRQLFERPKDYAFEFVSLEVENSRLLGRYSLRLVLLGLGLVFRWNHTETDEVKFVQVQAAKFEKFEKDQGRDD